MFVSLDQGTSKWVVKRFGESHNHLLHLLEHSHLLKSHRMVNEAQAINIDIVADISLSLKASHDLLSVQAGGKECSGFTRDTTRKSFYSNGRKRCQKAEKPLVETHLGYTNGWSNRCNISVAVGV
ncbi:hypothetical protein RHMOL_Rhmol08G0226500 [Rhododendron molle]|uniref:Uncharacterized protein n=1 Tax=Rhododendron molle TaxID=49168 RepID=A0ACC0MRM0_RHOML|nr:hypothetical protein RHMOL_Rhmol08G0226500 [Rhododendron molle]